MESQWIWPFELLDKVGEGGMGVVYRARYLGNDRQVAVKLLPAEAAANATLLARFEREMVVLKQLRHPHIVHCFGGTCEGDRRFYAMELVEGGTLAEILRKKKRLAWETVVDYAIQMCEALQYAHDHGIIHRDIKPSNFLVNKQGQLKLSDFGLVTVNAGRRLTATGRTLGTVDYMSPEQIRGKPALTYRSDLYALGCVMFEMASGHPPYTGENQMEILHKHLQEPIPRLAQTVLDIPEPVDELVFALLAKSPDDRPESAGEVARKLEDILQPGRRVDPVEPTLFRTRRTVKSLKEPVPATPSSDSIPAMKTVGIRLKPTWNWLLIGCLIFAGLLGWMGKIQSSNLLIAHEKYLIDQLEATDPLARKFAINALSQARDIQPTSVRKIRDVVMKGPDDVAIAAMSVMSNHPRQFRAYQWEIHKLQNHLEASPQLRHQAEATSTLLKSATINPRYWPGIPMIAGLIIAFLVAAIVIGVTLLRAEEPWKTFHLKLSRLLN